LVAQALHKHSSRSTGPFVAINTAAIPKDLLESELFGHERGAFTGAQTMRRGRFEQADGGTLFLDEIGDMPFDLQTRLLRVLSDGQFYRVGGHHPLKSNVRVIAATHQNLEDRVKQGVFREDLFHRLNVIRLRLPPLRERREDVSALARFFLQKSAKDLGVDAKRISEPALARLTAFDFPGNVRQLENICHWLTVMAPAQVIESKDLPPELMGVQPVAALSSPMTQPIAFAVPPAEPVAPMGNGGGGAVAPHEAHGVAAAEVPAAYASSPIVGGVGGFAPEAVSYPPAAPPSFSSGAPVAAAPASWLSDLEREARVRLESGATDVWDVLTRQFEAQLIHTALEITRGRRIEAAQKLGIGRNTITRKIQELGIED
jgi:two-component system nitrogen regulation response regulator GlnG